MENSHKTVPPGTTKPEGEDDKGDNGLLPSINNLLRRNCREKLFREPLKWTDRHLQLLNCAFVSRPPTVPSHDDEDANWWATDNASEDKPYDAAKRKRQVDKNHDCARRAIQPAPSYPTSGQTGRSCGMTDLLGPGPLASQPRWVTSLPELTHFMIVLLSIPWKQLSQLLLRPFPLPLPDTLSHIRTRGFWKDSSSVPMAHLVSFVSCGRLAGLRPRRFRKAQNHLS